MWVSVNGTSLNMGAFSFSTQYSRKMSVSAWKLFYYSDQTLVLLVLILSLEKCSISMHGKQEKNCNHFPKKSLFLSEIKAQPVKYLHTFHVGCLHKQKREYTNISVARPDDFTIQHWELVLGLFVGVSFQGAVPTDGDKTALAHIWTDIKPVRNQSTK